MVDRQTFISIPISVDIVVSRRCHSLGLGEYNIAKNVAKLVTSLLPAQVSVPYNQLGCSNLKAANRVATKWRSCRSIRTPYNLRQLKSLTKQGAGLNSVRRHILFKSFQYTGRWF